VFLLHFPHGDLAKIYCHFGVPQGSHLGPLFFIADIRVLAYADDLKLYMRVGSTDNYRLFQQELDRLHAGLVL
jgi:hypothetical protein